MDKEIITAVALGIGLAASCGFRVFVPLFAASIAARLGFFPLQEGFLWLASWPAIICFGAATFAEILAYYIPFIDNLLDSITTPMAIGAGTLLLTSVLPVDDDMLKWVTGLIIGGGAAATIQGGSVLTRLFSTTSSAGTGNHLVTTGENTAAIGSSVLTFVIPFVIAVAFILLAIFIIVMFGKKILPRLR